jgi:hypothetical protein
MLFRPPATEIEKNIKGPDPAPPSSDHASFYMLRLSRKNLEVRLDSIDESSLQSETQKKVYSRLVEMLKVPVNASVAARNLEWDEFYRVESLFGLLLRGGELRQEIGARLQDLALQSPAEAEARRRDYEGLLKPPIEGQGPADDDTLRMFLLRVMEAIHWNAKKKYLARPIRKEATNRVLRGLLFSFILLIAPYIYLVWDLNVGDSDLRAVSRVWSLFALWTALTAGLLGAFFSRLVSVQRQWSSMTLDEVFLHREWSYTLLRAGVGVCGALIVYFFLRSGIVTGALFPAFDEVRIELIKVPGEYKAAAAAMTFVMPSKALALLTFWCFLAGFSEALVPGILSTTEREFANAETPTQAPQK